MRSRVDYIAFLSCLILGLILIILVIGMVDPALFKIGYGPAASIDMILDFETLVMWRERGLDMVLQVLALSASLLGVLALLIGRGGRRD